MYGPASLKVMPSDSLMQAIERIDRLSSNLNRTFLGKEMEEHKSNRVVARQAALKKPQDEVQHTRNYEAHKQTNISCTHMGNWASIPNL